LDGDFGYFYGSANIPNVQTEPKTAIPIDQVTELITLHEAVKFLYGLLDDIDTISDMVKENDVRYRELVEKKVMDRYKKFITNQAFVTDGYTLFLAEDNEVKD
jgi:hypothetical protein